MFSRSKNTPQRRAPVGLTRGPLSQLNKAPQAVPDQLTPLIQGADASLGRNRDVLTAALKRTRMAKGGATAEAVRSIKNAIEHIRNRDPASAESELRRAPDPRARGVAGDVRNPRKIQSAIKVLEDIIAADTDEVVEATMAKGGKIKKTTKKRVKVPFQFVINHVEGEDFTDDLKRLFDEAGLPRRRIKELSWSEGVEVDRDASDSFIDAQLEGPEDLIQALKTLSPDGNPEESGGIEPLVGRLKEAIFGPSDEPDWAGAAQIASQIPGGQDIIAKLGTMKQAFDDPELDEETIRRMVLDLEATIDQTTGTRVPNPNLED